jgi:hypothetical protein
MEEEEEPMKSLSQLADAYERWAAEEDAIVTRIMKNVEGFPRGVRDEQLRQASLLTEEAESLRYHAARLKSFAVDGLRLKRANGRLYVRRFALQNAMKAMFLLVITTSPLLGQRIHIVSNVPKLTSLRVAGAPPEVQVIEEELGMVHLRLHRPGGGALRIPLIARSNTKYQLSVQGSDGVEVRVVEVKPFAGTQYVMPGAWNVSLTAPVSTSHSARSILEGPRISNGGNNSTPNNALLIVVETKHPGMDAELNLLMEPTAK